MIPVFNSDGNLPSGIHKASLKEIHERFGYNKKRQKLLTGLVKVVSLLKKAGCKTMYLNGSFITNEPSPNDYDLCWDPTGVGETPEFEAFLRNKHNRKREYLGDIFILWPTPPFYFDHVIEWQKDRDGNAKGLIKIVRERKP